MNRLLAGLLVSATMAAPVVAAALKPNDKAPDFSAKGSLAGKEFDFSLKSALKKGPVVVYFYPSAFTGGCNIQAHTFAENKETFDAAGASIIGVSRDSIARLNTRGVEIDHEFTERTTFVVTADGKIATTFSTSDDRISPAEHVQKALAAVQQLGATSRPRTRGLRASASCVPLFWASSSTDGSGFRRRTHVLPHRA